VPSLPAWAGALLVVGLFAAVVSSLDTVLLSGAAALAAALGPGERVPPRALVASYGAVGLLLGAGAPDLVSALLVGYALFGGAVVAPALAGLLGRRARPGRVLAGMLAGGVLAGAARLGARAGVFAAVPWAEALLLTLALALSGWAAWGSTWSTRCAAVSAARCADQEGHTRPLHEKATRRSVPPQSGHPSTTLRAGRKRANQ